MKILVLSDSHGQMEYMSRAVLLEQPNLVFHLGDHIRDADSLSELFQTTPVHRVAGNCDFAPAARDVIVEECAGVRFLLTHGHKHGVKSSLLRLALAAGEAGADIAVFGHTHCPAYETYDNIVLFNPGSCGGIRPSYGVITIVNGKVHCQHKTFED